MITDGKPAYVPWTAAVSAAQAICKPLAGGNWLPAGRAWAKAIAACPDCQFGALDVRTGFMVASAEVNHRDDCLARLAADSGRLVYWFGISPGVRPSHARFSPVEDDWCWPCAAKSFGEQLSLADRAQAFLVRESANVGRGFLLWFGGQGQLSVPGMGGAISVTLPALAVYGVFGELADVTWLDSFAVELVTISGAVAMAADRVSFAQSVAGVEWPATDARHQTRLSWLSNVIRTDPFEAGNVRWIEAARLESSAAFSATLPLPILRDGDGEPVEATSQFGHELATVELDSIHDFSRLWFEGDELFLTLSDYSPDLVPIEL